MIGRLFLQQNCTSSCESVMTQRILVLWSYCLERRLLFLRISKNWASRGFTDCKEDVELQCSCISLTPGAAGGNCLSEILLCRNTKSFWELQQTTSPILSFHPPKNSSQNVRGYIRLHAAWLNTETHSRGRSLKKNKTMSHGFNCEWTILRVYRQANN